MQLNGINKWILSADGGYNGIYTYANPPYPLFDFFGRDFSGKHTQVNRLGQGIGHTFAGSATGNIKADFRMQFLIFFGPFYCHWIEGKGSGKANGVAFSLLRSTGS
jgi:hypothetical protein